MAIDVSVTFSGNDVTFNQALLVQSFSWSAENEIVVGSASGGAGAGKAKPMEIVFTKQVDELASPLLFQKLVSGGFINNAAFEFRKTGGGMQASPTNKPWLTIHLTEVFVTQLTQSVSAGNEGMLEEVHLTYNSINMTFNGANAQGATTSGPSVGWNRVTNQSTQPSPPVA